MAKRKKLASMQLTRLEARTRVIDGAGRMMFVIFCMAIGFVVVATAFPQRRELIRLEEKLAMAKEVEESVKAEQEYHQTEYQALRVDKEFLEIHARDRLDYYREGERVLKFRND